MSFQDYLLSHLQGISLEPPLFYNSNIGIRFELGVPYRGIEDPLYFETVKKRSETLFESVFSESSELYIVRKTYEPQAPYEVFNPGVDVFAEYVDSAIINKVVCFENKPDYDEDTNQLTGYSKSFSLLCCLEHIDYKGILKAISYSEFPSKGNYIFDRIYFIHTKKNIVFHMYDDRGLDIVAIRSENLMNLFNEFNDWILDYDREKIERTFGKG
ncbi:DUF3885 domain-containing protein [Paenibacillus agri]|uniref:DUF3885 domain-containing protein n=1 Tax=Paenibacillus agri TaxID=2744309 RepID=A0A850EJJ5_9BACL|nr:DUF3885 domain-containing protein [Paenibacillus agri]NUU61108.1 DUF3885 domain-containing protein [Paenibacillus agri]